MEGDEALWEYPSNAFADWAEIVVEAEEGGDSADASTVMAWAVPSEDVNESNTQSGNLGIRTSPLFEDHQARPEADLARTCSAPAAAVARIAQEGEMTASPSYLAEAAPVPFSAPYSAGLRARSALV